MRNRSIDRSIDVSYFRGFSIGTLPQRLIYVGVRLHKFSKAFFFDAFTKSRLLASSCPSISPSICVSSWDNSTPTGRSLMKWQSIAVPRSVLFYCISSLVHGVKRPSQALWWPLGFIGCPPSLSQYLRALGTYCPRSFIYYKPGQYSHTQCVHCPL
jgi:hypothetical protein